MANNFFVGGSNGQNLIINKVFPNLSSALSGETLIDLHEYILINYYIESEKKLSDLNSENINTVVYAYNNENYIVNSTIDKNYLNNLQENLGQLEEENSESNQSISLEDCHGYLFECTLMSDLKDDQVEGKDYFKITGSGNLNCLVQKGRLIGARGIGIKNTVLQGGSSNIGSQQSNDYLFELDNGTFINGFKVFNGESGDIWVPRVDQTGKKIYWNRIPHSANESPDPIDLPNAILRIEGYADIGDITPTDEIDLFLTNKFNTLENNALIILSSNNPNFEWQHNSVSFNGTGIAFAVISKENDTASITLFPKIEVNFENLNISDILQWNSRISDEVFFFRKETDPVDSGFNKIRFKLKDNLRGALYLDAPNIVSKPQTSFQIESPRITFNKILVPQNNLNNQVFATQKYVDDKFLQAQHGQQFFNESGQFNPRDWNLSEGTVISILAIGGGESGWTYGRKTSSSKSEVYYTPGNPTQISKNNRIILTSLGADSSNLNSYSNLGGTSCEASYNKAAGGGGAGGHIFISYIDENTNISKLKLVGDTATRGGNGRYYSVSSNIANSSLDYTYSGGISSNYINSAAGWGGAISDSRANLHLGDPTIYSSGGTIKGAGSSQRISGNPGLYHGAGACALSLASSSVGGGGGSGYGAGGGGFYGNDGDYRGGASSKVEQTSYLLTSLDPLDIIIGKGGDVIQDDIIIANGGYAGNTGESSNIAGAGAGGCVLITW